MTKIKLLVGLKIPDTTAITAFNTLKKMGINIEELEREDYYEFILLKDSDKFMKDIAEVDILVNANKNYSKVYREEIGKEEGFVYVVVRNKEKDLGLRETLMERMGFKNIAEMHKGVLWKFKASEEEAEKAVKELLHNPHYQEFELL